MQIKELSMRRIVLSFLGAFVIIVLCAQPRIDGNFSTKVKEESPLLTNIVGWGYDKTNEKWAGHYNVIIPVFKGNNNIKPARINPRNRDTYDNIINLQMKSVLCNDSVFYFLYHRFWRGSWDYPALQIDWRTSKETAIYILTSEEFSKMKNLQMGENIINIYKVSWTGEENALTFAKVTLKDILENPSKAQTPDKIVIKKENENTIRLDSKIWQSYKPFGSDGYFEIKLSDFNCLFKLSRPTTGRKK